MGQPCQDGEGCRLFAENKRVEVRDMSAEAPTGFHKSPGRGETKKKEVESQTGGGNTVNPGRRRLDRACLLRRKVQGIGGQALKREKSNGNTPGDEMPLGAEDIIRPQGTKP